MPVDNQSQRQYYQSRSQQRKLDAYSKARRYCTMDKIREVDRTTARGEVITLKLPPCKSPYVRGRALQECACREINSIPLTERNEKLAAAADAYLLARRQIESSAKYGAFHSSQIILSLSCVTVISVLPVVGAIAVVNSALWIMLSTALLKDVKDTHQTIKLMKSILHENYIETSDILKKVKFSKMDLQPSNRSEKSLMRNGASSMALPVNARKTRNHLKEVFAGNPEQRAKLNNILRNRSNYGYLPNQNDTKDGHLKESGWRKILELLVEPNVIPSTHSNLDSEGENIQMRVVEPASASTNDQPPTYDEVMAQSAYTTS